MLGTNANRCNKKKRVGLHHRGFERQNRTGLQPRPKKSGKFPKTGAKCESQVSAAIDGLIENVQGEENREPHE